MACYVTLDQVKDLGSMPADDIAAIETQHAGLTLRIATAVSADVDSRLRKRYPTPLQTPYPDAIVLLVARMTAWRLWLKRGFNPDGAIDKLLKEDETNAQASLREIVDGQSGLAEIPLSQSSSESGVTRGGPLCSSQASPYTWIYQQADLAQDDEYGIW